MSSRAEQERRRVQESGSPLADHSLSNRNTKASMQGLERITPTSLSLKAIRAGKKHARILEELTAERIGRIQVWLPQVLQTGYSIVDFPNETSYLRRYGINIKNFLEDSKN